MMELRDLGRKQAVEWNGGIGQAQMSWLQEELKMAAAEKQRVILFNHFPAYPENVHNLWNAEELVALIGKHPVVAAYMNGHFHAGRYSTHQACHFLNFKGMVETEKETAYAVVRCFPDRLEIEGYGLEPDRNLGKL